MLAPVFALAALALSAAPKLAVMPIAAGEGVPPSTAAAVTDALAAEVRRRSGAEVITRKEIETVLSLEAQKAMLGCQSDACFAEIGGALGVERLVAGDLARLGESWLFHLKLVETGKVKVAAQSDRRIRGGTIDDVLDALPPMAAELFPGPAPKAAPAAPAATGAPPAPPAPPAAASARPAPVPWAEEPITVEPREKRAVFTDGAGHLVAVVPNGGTDEPLFSGDARKLFRARVIGGGRDGQGGWSLTFWDPRFPSGWQRSLEGRPGDVHLQCGDRKIPLRLLPPREARAELRGARYHAPRWRRYAQALARDDDGNYYLLDGSRGADQEPEKKPEYRFWVGPKGRMAPVEIVDVLRDPGGLVAITSAGKLTVKPDRDGTRKAEWTAKGAAPQPLTFLAPEDHGPLLYRELSPWAGHALGTPCDPFVETGR